MSQGQGVVTDHLVNIIQTIQLRHGTGLLTAKRGVGNNLEEGRLIFTNGKVTEAHCGRHTGPDALNYLSTWERCLVLFVSQQVLQDLIVSRETSISSAETIYSSTQMVPYTPRPDSTESVVPQLNYSYTSALEITKRMNFSRPHRQLLLLIDGKRSADDLAQLFKRDLFQIYTILQDLAHAKIIRW
jgi:hypothetical protein